ncbi:MAG: HRDC domain-containing protein [Bacteroidales bacterium]|nr:HRDC domain-containing protein [Bacteroidales bacterium]
MNNPQLELARRYVEQTSVSLFLTGKAGTGKTTFLHHLDTHCTKRHVVVASTGVAAVNAGGVTIHSFFQLPFDPYLPDVKELVTEYQMPASHKSLSKQKINIIRTLDLLIIDEISMVRADLLDAIDMTLRRYRRNSQPFGGVQLLMIGDVHQLAPVVTERERPYMERVYPSPFFFNSKALQRIHYATIELTTVYRQQDAAFVDLLNRVRDNRMDTDTLRQLNSRLGQPPQGAIILTTHNRQADAINRRHMAELTGEQRTFEAIVKGNFPDSALPADRTLELKVGERVMFLKNDSSGGHRYYNGKLATVTGFGDNTVEVIDDDGDTIHANRELWENNRYNIDSDTGQIRQEVEGTFSQYPLRAAWAVTIHKAQGLTFDRVGIDAADAFAFGQVYVALSRCRTLEGLTLTTPLSANVTFNDQAVAGFTAACPTFEQTSSEAEGHERRYRMEKLMELFSMDALIHDAEHLLEQYSSRLKNIYPKEVETLRTLCSSLADLGGVSEKFRLQLGRLTEERQDERAGQGAAYYQAQLNPLLSALAALLEVEIDNKETQKAVKEAGEALSERLGSKLACLEAVCREGYSVETVQKARTSYLLRDSKAAPRRKPAATTATTPQGHLIQALHIWRKAKAEELGRPAYFVLNQKTLMALASLAPKGMHELLAVPGIGKAKAEQYGAELLELIANASQNASL